MPLQLATGIQYCLVLSLHRNDVLATFGVKTGGPFDRKVVGLRGARRPDDFTGICVNEGRDLVAGALDGLFGFPSVGMATGSRVSEMLEKPGHHLVDHTRIHRGRGRVVEINGTRRHVELLKRQRI